MKFNVDSAKNAIKLLRFETHLKQFTNACHNMWTLSILYQKRLTPIDDTGKKEIQPKLL